MFEGASSAPIKFLAPLSGNGNGFVFTFLLTFSSLFWCAGHSLQDLNITEHKLALHLPALESRDPASKEKSRKRDICRANAAIL